MTTTLAETIQEAKRMVASKLAELMRDAAHRAVDAQDWPTLAMQSLDGVDLDTPADVIDAAAEVMADITWEYVLDV